MPVAHRRRQLGHGAEIEEDQRAVGADEHVPGVRIGVVDAVDEDHLAVGAHEPVRQILLVDAQRVDGADVADLLAVDERRRDHAFVENSRTGWGRPRMGFCVKFFAMRSMLLASRAKSSSSRSRALIWW